MRMHKRKNKGKKSLLFCLICACLLSGCQKQNLLQEQPSQAMVQNVDEMEPDQREGFIGEEMYEQNFTKPQVTSNIFVDLMGYAPDDQKHAYFVGDNLSETFYVYESTGQLAYTGELKEVRNANINGKSIYRGDFTSLKEAGVYYIQTAVIGQSYTFSIDENRYKSQLEQLKTEYLELTPEEFYQPCESWQERVHALYAFQKLSVAYSFFPDALGEEFAGKLEEHMLWFLDMRKEVLQERKDRTKQEENNTQEAKEQMVWEDYMFASAISAGHVVVQQSNTVLAGQAYQNAQASYQNASKMMVETELKYMAAASLYKVSGNYAYHAVIKETYNQSATETSQDVLDEPILGQNIDITCQPRLWGNLFYMTAEKGADVTICDKQMSELMNQCEEYLIYGSQSAFGHIVEEQDGLEHAIWPMIADYTIVSRDYRNIYKQQMHLLLYNNIEEMNLTQGQRATLFLLLGNLIESEGNE